MPQLGNYTLAENLFADRITQHRLEFPDIEALEHAAVALAWGDFQQPESLRFLRQICRWGGYYGIAARVRRSNKPNAICAAFRGAWTALQEQEVVPALAHINALHGLGRPSFASKFLRFLAPMHAPILDRVISMHTGFPLTGAGYGQLTEWCLQVAAELVAAGIANPVRPDGVWFIADIEAAFYADMWIVEE